MQRTTVRCMYNATYRCPVYVCDNVKLSDVCMWQRAALKVIYHPLYGMNNYVLIWGDWLSCDPLRGSHDSQSPHIREHLCPILWQRWFICHKNYSYYIRGDRSPLKRLYDATYICHNIVWGNVQLSNVCMRQRIPVIHCPYFTNPIFLPLRYIQFIRDFRLLCCIIG